MIYSLDVPHIRAYAISLIAGQYLVIVIIRPVCENMGLHSLALLSTRSGGAWHVITLIMFGLTALLVAWLYPVGKGLFCTYLCEVIRGKVAHDVSFARILSNPNSSHPIP